ncbi:MAG: transglycosylase SLT domain-containing protein [Burkholderiaceae bacterium]
MRLSAGTVMPARLRGHWCWAVLIGTMPLWLTACAALEFPRTDSATVESIEPATDDSARTVPAEPSLPTQPTTMTVDAPVPAESAQIPASTRPAGPVMDQAPQGQVQAPATPELIDPLQPGVSIEPADDDEQIDLWTRLRQGFAMTDLEGGLVRAQEQWYATRPDYVRRMTERGGRYLFHIVREVERRGLPTELALLPFIESAFNPEAMSSARASGMWQFMPATGRNFDLKQNVFRDDRRDVLASTRAALDYLEKLYAMFGDWHLALAAYNWGEGSVARAIAKNRAARKLTGYDSLKMPHETRHYVPKLQAVKNIVARPGEFGLALPELANHPYFLSVPIQRDIDVDVAARLAGMTVEEFRALNPQMNKPVILAAGTPQVLLPYDNANRFVQELPEYPGRLASWTAWVAPTTLKPSEAARRVGMNEAKLRELNAIPQHMLIKAGSTLLVPRSDAGGDDVSEHVADNGTIVLTPDGTQVRRVLLRAGRRDSVATVARRYRTTQENVAQWNDVDVGSAFRAGQKVTVFVPAKTARAKSGSAARPSLRTAPKPLLAVKPAKRVQLVKH